MCTLKIKKPFTVGCERLTCLAPVAYCGAVGAVGKVKLILALSSKLLVTPALLESRVPLVMTVCSWVLGVFEPKDGVKVPVLAFMLQLTVGT